MSHLAKINLEIKDLGALKKACETLGLKLVEEQKTFRWFAGKKGKCQHAICQLDENGNVKEGGENHENWQIGITQDANKPGTYVLQWDPYAGGGGLCAKVGGRAAHGLQQEYAKEIALQNVPVGFSVVACNKVNGSYQLQYMKA